MKKSYELYQKIITERGLSTYRVAMSTGTPQSMFSLWKLKGVVPKWERLNRVALYLSTPERPLTAADFYALDAEDPGEGGK